MGINVAQDKTSEEEVQEVQEVQIAKHNTKDLYSSPTQEGSLLQASQLSDTNPSSVKSDKDQHPERSNNFQTQEPVMTVTHNPDIKDKIDLTCLADGTAPPPIHQYLKLKTIPLKESKKIMTKISLKKGWKQ